MRLLPSRRRRAATDRGPANTGDADRRGAEPHAGLRTTKFPLLNGLEQSPGRASGGIRQPAPTKCRPGRWPTRHELEVYVGSTPLSFEAFGRHRERLDRSGSSGFARPGATVDDLRSTLVMKGSPVRVRASASLSKLVASGHRMRHWQRDTLGSLGRPSRPTIPGTPVTRTPNWGASTPIRRPLNARLGRST